MVLVLDEQERKDISAWSVQAQSNVSSRVMMTAFYYYYYFEIFHRYIFFYFFSFHSFLPDRLLDSAEKDASDQLAPQTAMFCLSPNPGGQAGAARLYVHLPRAAAGAFPMILASVDRL